MRRDLFAVLLTALVSSMTVTVIQHCTATVRLTTPFTLHHTLL